MSQDKKAKLTFCGGTGTVTGANFLFEIDGKKILVDCGLTQVSKLAEEINWSPFPYDPKSIDILFVTHAHVDHIGRIPKLLNEGFRGEIYSTFPTKELTMPMLEDTAGILSKSSHYNLEKIYSDENVRKTFERWSAFNYGEKIKITPSLEAHFENAGHILGSGMVVFVYNGKKIVFTGDLGNSPSPLLPDTATIKDADYMIMESVYGDRNHESRNDRRLLLERVIEENHKKCGTLLIPTFSLERSQELLFELNDLVENHRIPVMPIFFDSPLAIRLTEIFKKYGNEYFNETAKKALSRDKYIFNFPGLHSTLRSEDSKLINESANPKIIIAGSGMSSGGRIVHHERHYLPDPNNTILLNGYQALGSLGRAIQDGAKFVHITGEEVAVRASVRTILGYSGHKDGDGLFKFVEDTQDSLKKLFIVMGEPSSAMFLAQRIKDNLGVNAIVPSLDDIVDLDFS